MYDVCIHIDGHGTAGGMAGHFLYGFSMPLQDGDIVGAELMAILEGIVVCNRRNINGFEIETDCSVAYQMIVKPENCQWKYKFMVRSILKEIDDPSRLIEADLSRGE